MLLNISVVDQAPFFWPQKLNLNDFQVTERHSDLNPTRATYKTTTITNMILHMRMFCSKIGKYLQIVSQTVCFCAMLYLLIVVMWLHLRFLTNWEKGVSFISRLEKMLGLEKNTFTNPR